MRRSAFNVFSSRAGIAALLIGLVVPAGRVVAQEASADSKPRILSSEISISRSETELKLELANGDQITIRTTTGPQNRVIRSRTRCGLAAIATDRLNA